MFPNGIFVRKGHYRVDSTGNPALISKSLINEFLKLSAFHDKYSLSLRYFFSNLHNIVRTLKTYGHEADLRSEANMEQIVTTLAIARR